MSVAATNSGASTFWTMFHRRGTGSPLFEYLYFMEELRRQSLIEESNPGMLKSIHALRSSISGETFNVRPRRQTLANVGGRRQSDSQEKAAHTCNHYRLLYWLCGFACLH